MTNDLTSKNSNPAPALSNLFEQDAGHGVSFNPEDQLIPLIYVLQNGSPICEKRSQNYIEGAAPGNFWLRNSIHPIADGETGLVVIPCGMQRTWVEWLPNRGGFVMRHSQPPKDMVNKTVKGDDGRERPVLSRPNGNLIQDTREFFLLVEGQPYVLPCSGTKHSFARQWNSLFTQFTLPEKPDIIAPSFARKYRLTTVPAQNALGKWYGLRFADLGWLTEKEEPEYKAARALYRAMQQGTKKAEAPVTHDAPVGDDDIPF